MSFIKQLMQIENWMNVAFEHERFDTFKMLSSDRMRLLQRALKSSEKKEVFELAQQQSKQWTKRLEERIERGRAANQKKKRLANVYGANAQSSKGKVLRLSF